jgi:hypothetical protein
MENETVEIAKVLGNMSARVEELMKNDPKIRSRESAIALVASSKLASDLILWRMYKAVAAAPDLTPERVPITKSEAMLLLERKARTLQKRDPTLSAASAFARIYSDPRYRELVEADKAAHLARAYGL